MVIINITSMRRGVTYVYWCTILTLSN